jgi:7-cyano-7-deazaguanine synthase
MTKRAVILLSGGIDSTTCLAIAKNAGFASYALSFNYGQRSQVELQAAQKIAKQLGAVEHRIVDLTDLGRFGGSAITDHNLALKTSQHDHQIPTSYVPGRNTVFLSIALSWAEALDAEAIFIGVHDDDTMCYPDCRPAYIDAYQQMANLANKRGVEGNPIHIETPILTMKKSDIVALGAELGVDYRDTVTCYQADNEGRACGQCLSCTTRRESFLTAQLPDPTRYV